MGSIKFLQMRQQVADCITELANDLAGVAGELLEIAHMFEKNEDGLTGVARHRDYLYLLAEIQNVRLDVLAWERSATFAQPLKNRQITASHETELQRQHQELSRLFQQG